MAATILLKANRKIIFEILKLLWQAVIKIKCDTKLFTYSFLIAKYSIQSFFNVFLLERPWQRQLPLLGWRRDFCAVLTIQTVYVYPLSDVKQQ